MSQGIEEISHFRKSQGSSRNAEAIEEIPELPRHLQDRGRPTVSNESISSFENEYFENGYFEINFEKKVGN